MKIGTIVFTYHRSEHTKKVLDALSKNSILPEKLYLFQDGMKDNTNHAEWEKVNELVKNISWCKTKVFISEKNQGLARSIVSGVGSVLQECDAVIVLEDDCVPCKQFMKFMVSALNSYEKIEKVYSVSGYAWDVNLPCQGEDAYFNGRISSWGWGTWKDRWNQYEENYHILDKIKNDPGANERLHIWGADLEGMLTGNVTGSNNSWAVFWALKIIEKGGYCLSPYKQLIHNIGFDGSGVHSGILQENHVVLEDTFPDAFHLPQKAEITKECEEEFQFLFAGKHGMEKMKLYQDMLIQWIQMKQMDRQIHIPDGWGSEIAVWGKGKILDRLISELKGQVSVKYIVESRPSITEYNGIPITSIRDLPDNVKNVIVIPFFDLSVIRTKVKKVRPDICLLGIDELFQGGIS